jgi:hypothetical protein
MEARPAAFVGHVNRSSSNRSVYSAYSKEASNSSNDKCSAVLPPAVPALGTEDQHDVVDAPAARTAATPHPLQMEASRVGSVYSFISPTGVVQ